MATLRRKTAKGALVLAGGRAAGQGLGFVRNVLIARMVGPEDFGIAATFAVTMSLLEMLSDMAMDRLLVQAADGDEPRLQATAQLLQAARGLVLGLLLLAFAGPIAALFGAGEAVWAFRVLAVVPVVRGLAHLDVKRVHRDLAFGPAAAVDVVSQAAAVAAAYPLGAWLGDYSAALWLVVLQAVSYAVATHVAAARQYRWAWDRELARRFMSFGWPLLINGSVMFLILQGDRIAIGAAFSRYTLEDLGVYSAAAAVAYMPSALLSTLNQSLVLPLLAPAAGDRPAFEARLRTALEATGFAGGAMTVALIASAGPVIGLLYGNEYAAAAGLLPWVALVQGARLVRMSPTMAGMALGDTRNIMWAGVARASVLPVVFAVAVLGLDIRMLIAVGVAGELLAIYVSAAGLRSRHGLRTGDIWRSAGVFSLAVAIFGLAPAILLEDYTLSRVLLGGCGCLMLAWRARSVLDFLGARFGGTAAEPAPSP